jgi:hypothetical protein
MPNPRSTAFIALLTSLTLGILYSLLFNTYLDTSDPTISSLPHPLHSSSYFASKSNIFNTWFVKRAWGWTSVAFLFMWGASPSMIRTRGRLGQYVIATLVWMAFTTWFFGPAIIDRVVSYSGGQCVLILPSPSNEITSASYLSVPSQFCHSKARLSPLTHPELFITPLTLPQNNEWSARPRFLRGHDVSGHIFLLTLAVLFLADQLDPLIKLHQNSRLSNTVSRVHRVAMYFGIALSALWIWMVLMTSVYWHTPHEKITGFGTYPTILLRVRIL